MASERVWQAWLNRHGPSMLVLARPWMPGRDDTEGLKQASVARLWRERDRTDVSIADAVDVMQEAFLRFWRARERTDVSIADPVAYLFGCVKHAAMDCQRGGRRRARREEAAGLAAAPEASGRDPMLTGELEREERRVAIEAALVQLSEPQREALVMKVWAGLSFPQIAQALGIPPDTAASRYRYALAKLRGQLAEELIP